MASSMISRLCVVAGRFSTRLSLRYQNRQNENLVRSLRERCCYNCKPKTVSVAGMSIGVSYALFGFSFGKKEEEDVDPLTARYRQARLAHVRRDLQAADDLYHECLKLADDLVKAKEITEEKYVTARTLMYDGLADIALQSGQVDVAENLYKETMKGCLSQGMKENHNTMVEIAFKLASIYAMQGKKELAEEGFKFCIAAQTPKMEAREKEWLEKDSKLKKAGKKVEVLKDETEGSEVNEKDTAALLGMTLSSYGRFLLYERRYSEALPLFEKARMYAEHTLGTDSNQYLVVLNDIATINIVTKNLDKAEKVLKEGIALSEKSKLGEGSMLYCNLGAVYLRKGEVSNALSHCQRALNYAKEFDHKIAFKMAEACIEKGVRMTHAKAKEVKASS